MSKTVEVDKKFIIDLAKKVDQLADEIRKEANEEPDERKVNSFEHTGANFGSVNVVFKSNTTHAHAENLVGELNQLVEKYGVLSAEIKYHKE